MAASFRPLASRNSSRSSGYMRTLRMLPIGMEIVCASVTPSSEPLAM